MDDLQLLGILLGLSFAPPLLLAVWIRNHERHDPEPWRGVLGAFVYGATVGVAVAFVLNTLFDTAANRFTAESGLSAGFLTAVVAAPFIEEMTKGFGLGTQRRRIRELEDGLVYGAAIGLGFAASENLLYGVSSYLEGGLQVAVTTLVFRVLSSMILHAGTTAMLGFGYSQMVLRGGVGLQLIPFYLIAVLLHGTYNLLVTIQSGAGFVAAVILVWVVLSSVRRRIRTLDALPHEPV